MKVSNEARLESESGGGEREREGGRERQRGEYKDRDILAHAQADLYVCRYAHVCMWVFSLQYV